MTGEWYFVGPDADPDKYRLLQHIGGGGEAELWEGDVLVGGGRERVAIKVLRTEHVGRVDQWRQRWDEQVDLLRLIRHPGVVGVHLQFEGALMHRPGQAGAESERALYMVMNWVDGQALRDWVPLHRDPADRAAVMRTLGQVAAVLDWLHSGRATPSGRPIVHGDISPANVIFNTEGQAVLVDFGLFRIAQHITEVPAGTRGYCAPEILREGHYSPASDRYAFGGLAYYMLTGTHPPADPATLREQVPRIAAHAEGEVSVGDLTTIFADAPEQRPTARDWLRTLRLQSSTALPTTVVAPPRPAPVDASPPVKRPLATAGAAWWTPLRIAVAAGLTATIAVSCAWWGASQLLPGVAAGPSNPAAATTGAAARATSPGPIPSLTNSKPTPTISVNPSRARVSEPWPGEPTGLLFISGTAQLCSTCDNNSYDFDKNETVWSLVSLDRVDITSGYDGIGTQNGMVFGPWTGGKPPTLADCRAVAEPDWFTYIDNKTFDGKQTYCVWTAEGRYGYFRAQGVEYYNTSNRASDFNFTFLLWKMPGDR